MKLRGGGRGSKHIIMYISACIHTRMYKYAMYLYVYFCQIIVILLIPKIYSIIKYTHTHLHTYYKFKSYTFSGYKSDCKKIYTYTYKYVDKIFV